MTRRPGSSRDRGRGKGDAGGPAAAQAGELRLYVMGQSALSLRAQRNAERICSDHLGGKVRLTVIDLAEEPHRARTDRILAVPTLVRAAPGPPVRIVGDLSDTAKVLAALDPDPAAEPDGTPKD